MKTDENNRSVHFYLLNLRTMLSHFARFMQAFDPLMARQFDRFTKSAINHRAIAEHVEPLIERFEETGDIN